MLYNILYTVYIKYFILLKSNHKNNMALIIVQWFSDTFILFHFIFYL